MFTTNQMLSIDTTVSNIKQECTGESTEIKLEQPSSSTDGINNEGQNSISTVGHAKIKTESSSHSPKRQIKQEKIRKKVMGSQARELIALVYQHMKKEAVEGVKNVTDARLRTSQATGVSQKTVSRILKEKRRADETGSPIRSPHRNKKPRKCLKRDIEKAHADIIRKTISTYQSEFNKAPTLNGLKDVLKERINFNGCIETLRRVLLELGYEFKSTQKNSQKMLVQKSSV